MYTTNRTRPICKPVYFTEDEWLSVATKMAESDMPNFSAFCREMLLTGKVKHYDFSVIKEISSSLSHISGNINQVAKRCNTNQSVTTNDVEQLRREYLQLKSLYQERLMKASLICMQRNIMQTPSMSFASGRARVAICFCLLLMIFTKP